jgi:hypothetical protein
MYWRDSITLQQQRALMKNFGLLLLLLLLLLRLSHQVSYSTVAQ